MFDFRRDSTGDGDLFPSLTGTASHLRVRRGSDVRTVDGAPEDTADSRAEDFIGSAVSELKLRFFLGTLFLLLAMVVGRTVAIQATRGAEYSQRAENNRIRTERVPSERGIIYDRRSRPLTMNVPNFTMLLTPIDLPRTPQARRDLLARLSGIIATPPADIENRLKVRSQAQADPVVVADNLTHDQAVLIAIEAAHTPGLSLSNGLRREYPEGRTVPSLSHVIGYPGRINPREAEILKSRGYGPDDAVGLTGLERTYEQALRGVYGFRRVELDARAELKRSVSEDSGTPGQNLVLAIDLDLQRQAEAALRDGLAKVNRRRGAVVVIDPRDGAIRALVSWPAYDDNSFAQGVKAADLARLNSDPDRPLYPRAVAGQLPAGSTFKLAGGAGAIDSGLVKPTTSFVSSGGLQVGRWFFPDWKAGGHGVTNLTKAIAESVNTYFYTIGGGFGDFAGMGPDMIVSYASRFGMGSKLGIDLPNEQTGLLPTREWKKTAKNEAWYVGDTYNISIGQGGILVTPLQIAAMTSVFANGGTLFQPRVVDTVIKANGQRQRQEPVVISKQVVSAAAISAVRQGMRAAVTVGSARSLADVPVAVAAKTGTAQWHSERLPHAWFTSFAPYDQPELVVTVIIEEGGEGSQAAAPVAKSILNWYFGAAGKPARS